MRVLITNITLGSRTGTEINVRDVALGLLGRGHTPIVYSPELGPLADELRRRTVAVVDDLDDVGATPDVIHGHHHPETMMALQRFPGVPAVYFSHDFTAWHDAAPHFPRILRYVAVDEANRDRLALQHGVPEARIRIVLNAVDTDRFRPRGPLPPRPRRALVFSHYASERTHALAVREACRRMQLPLDIVGADAGAPTPAPEDVLGAYDLVFAKGRCALEALAVGAAVVLLDRGGLGAMVTSADVDRLRRDNFGRRLLRRALDPALIVEEAGRYDAADAAKASARIRATADLQTQLDQLLALYGEVVAENAGRGPDVVEEGRAAATYYRAWGPRFRDGELRTECDRRAAEIARLSAERDELQREVERLAAALERGQAAHAAAARLQTEHDTLRAQHRHLESRAASLATERDRLAGELGYVNATATWRLHQALLRSRAVVWAYRGVRAVAAPASRWAARLAPRRDP
ncbi:MAG TPA: glycosyltransferase [Candidatus Eisenbacteria bacterium]|nr:glycosyltransferase [Candidatus Eisenbacteria bacterium]